MRFLVPLLVVLLPGCIWVSNSSFDERWDADGDGYPLDDDCAPHDPDVHPGAADWRGDGCDADCGTEPDRDGDDWPDDADCAPDDETAFPCSTLESGDLDVDCDGIDGISRPEGDCEYARADPDVDEQPGPLDCETTLPE